MNLFATLYCRTVQFITNKIVMPFVYFPEPKKVSGAGSLDTIPSWLKEEHYFCPFVLTGRHFEHSEAGVRFFSKLTGLYPNAVTFDEIPPNPTFDSIYAAYYSAKKTNCDVIVAIGGGSVIDAAKAVGALLANPRRPLSKMKGVLKIRHHLPMLLAIPTTAGTGSEATVAAVVTDSKTHDKFAINDPHLIPKIAVLDDTLLSSLPPSLIASTGMDALTHAVEAYLGNALTKKTSSYALQSVRLIHDNLLDFYRDPSNASARQNMQEASYLAGVAFTRSYVGYVHAIAHSLGGAYNVPHGFANAVILPYVLRAYGKKAEKKLARLSDVAKLTEYGETREKKAEAFVSWIEKANEAMGIPKQFHQVIQPKDIPLLARHAAKEANPLYPVPKELSAHQLTFIYKELDDEFKNENH
ncbi:MAG: iron-containing alcohol dehydrogenase [Erysipelotrichaceae bacterium]|nr:iron-containing alcohol dehydrogenase [Erysipelotrichaceae bacterium]